MNARYVLPAPNTLAPALTISRRQQSVHAVITHFATAARDAAAGLPSGGSQARRGQKKAEKNCACFQAAHSGTTRQSSQSYQWIAAAYSVPRIAAYVPSRLNICPGGRKSRNKTVLTNFIVGLDAFRRPGDSARPLNGRRENFGPQRAAPQNTSDAAYGAGSQFPAGEASQHCQALSVGGGTLNRASAGNGSAARQTAAAEFGRVCFLFPAKASAHEQTSPQSMVVWRWHQLPWTLWSWFTAGAFLPNLLRRLMAAGLFCAVAGVAGAQACKPFDEVNRILIVDHGELPEANGWAERGGEVTADLFLYGDLHDGSWTIISVNPEGIACVLFSGWGFKRIHGGPL